MDSIALGEVKGQLNTIMALLASQHEATNRRIDDFRSSIEGRLTGHADRIATLEKNERNTAIKTASVGAIAGAASSAAMTALLQLIKHGP
jgi:hypothetical protein